MNENIVFLIGVIVVVMFMAKREETVLREIVVTSRRRPSNDFEGPYAPGKSPSELGLNGVDDE